MEGDTNQSMSPVTAFLRVWKETPINQCHLWLPSWGYGRRHQSINQCHLWLPSWGYGRRHQSINVTCNCLLEVRKEKPNQSMSPVAAFLGVRKEGETNQSMSPGASINKCHLWLPSSGYGGKRLSASPPGILRGRVQCRQAGGWRGTQTLTQKEHNNYIKCDKQTFWKFVSRKEANCMSDSMEVTPGCLMLLNICLTNLNFKTR